MPHQLTYQHNLPVLYKIGFIAYQEFLIFSLMLAIHPRVPIFAPCGPCWHIRNADNLRKKKLRGKFGYQNGEIRCGQNLVQILKLHGEIWYNFVVPNFTIPKFRLFQIPPPPPVITLYHTLQPHAVCIDRAPLGQYTRPQLRKPSDGARGAWHPGKPQHIFSTKIANSPKSLTGPYPSVIDHVCQGRRGK